MPIPVTCDCGKAIRVKEEYAGRRVRCPGCNEPLLVPLAEAEPEVPVLEAQPADPEPPRRKPRRREVPDMEIPEVERVEAEDDDRPFAVTESPSEKRKSGRKRRSLDEEARLDDIKKESRKFRREPGGRTTDGGSGGAGGAGVLGGLAMMVIAVLWFVGGLAGGIIFFYPPVLFVLGLAAFIGGLVNR